MIVEAQGLRKTYGSVVAVNDLSFTVSPGHITGFLGPNGSGKSTTMRLMLGLDHGAGTTLFDGRPLAEHRPVSTVVGSHLDAKFFHPRRTARAHLRMMGSEAGISKARINEVIALVGLQAVAEKRPGGFSLGMGQRLGLATALLASPRVLLLDEPANGLDPQSIHWLRDFLRDYAAGGRSVFVSSHLLTEMELMADHLVVIAQGRLVSAGPMDEFVARSVRNDVLVRTDTDHTTALADALTSEGLDVSNGDGALVVQGADCARIGRIAFGVGAPVLELSARSATLEQAFLELTSDQQGFRTGGSAS